MKVILLAPLPPPSGGIASWAKRMQNAELKNGWSQVIVDEKVIGGRGIFGGKTKINIFVELKRCINIWKNLWIELNDKNARVVHSSIPAGVAGMIREIICAGITKLRGRKFIIHFRCTIPNMVKSKKSVFVFKLLLKFSDAVITLNTPSLLYVKNAMPKKKAVLIPNFVSLDEMEINKIGKNEKVTVLYVGGVIQEKGCKDIINCASKTPNIDYRLIGAIGEDMKECRFPSNVTLTGEKCKADVQKELKNADIFMFVSYFRGEGFSNALAEAMAYKLPCIVSDWAANKDMIENSGGYVVPVHDVDSMVESVLYLASNSYIRSKMGEWNYTKVYNNYSQEIITSKYIDLYEQVL